jgi:tetratricopeptide (TPR) repeat protein
MLRKALRINPAHEPSMHDLANALYLQGRYLEAIAVSKKAIDRNEYHVGDLFNTLSFCLRAQGKLAEAEAAQREAMARNSMRAQYNAGYLLMGEGHFTAALPVFRKLMDEENLHALQAIWAEHFIQLDQRLAEIMAGEAQPTSAPERLALADLCRRPSHEYFATSARLYAEAFDADPNSVGEIRAEIRYSAACAAVQAGCGQGKDASKPDAAECARLRGRAVAWLRADLSGWLTEMKTGTKSSRNGVIYEMEWWQQDPALACVRGDQALAKLPEAERHEWHGLWEEVEELRQQAWGKR